MIEFSDLIFAFDSIPAVFSVSLDPYVVLFANIFAILWVCEPCSSSWQLWPTGSRYLKTGVCFLLLFIGLKLLVHEYFEIDAVASLLDHPGSYRDKYRKLRWSSLRKRNNRGLYLNADGFRFRVFEFSLYTKIAAFNVESSDFCFLYFVSCSSCMSKELDKIPCRRIRTEGKPVSEKGNDFDSESRLELPLQAKAETKPLLMNAAT